MSLDKTLLGVAKSAVDTQRKSRDGRNVVSKGVDAVTNKSYANEDKKVAAAALRKWENEVWKPKTEARLKQEMSERVSHLKPGSDAYNQTYQSLYNKNHQGLQAAKTKTYQQLGTLRQKGQTQRQVDNNYTQKESLRNNTAKIQSAASVGRDVAEEAAGALATGTSRALRYPLQLAADVGENDDGSIFDRGAKALERHEDNLQQVYPAYADTQQNGSFTENLTLSAIEQIPNLALSFTGAGAAAKGAQLAGAGAKMTAATAYGTAAATMYPQAYGDGNDSTKQELENATPEQLATAVRSKDIYKGHFDKNIKAGMSEDEAYQKARDQTISSIAEESGDAVGLATLALSMLAPGVGSFTANRAAGGAVSQWGQKVFNKLAVKADAGKVAKVAVPAVVGAGIVVLNVAEEGLQEGFTDKVAQQAAVDVGVKEKLDMDQLKESVLMGGILGGLMGGGVYVGTRNSKLHQAQDDLNTAQQAYAEVAGQIPQLQQQIEEVSPRSPEGQALTAQLEETRSVLDAMAAEAEKASIPRTSLARRAPRIEPTNSAASDFDGQVDGATELDDQGFENALNPDGTPAPQATPAAPVLSEKELDAQDAQIAELIAEQAALDEAIEDGSNEKPLEESIAAAQSWYDSKRGEGKQGLAGVVSRAAATEQDAAFAQQQESIKGATASINDYIASERAKQQQLDAEIEQDALAAKTEREKKEVEQRARQREIDRAQEDELLAKREQLAQPYENESFDTTVIGADGAPFNLARFWDSNMPAAAKAKAIADAFGGQVEQNVAKADWQSMPEGVQKELHQWFAERLDGIRQSREGAAVQTSEQVAAPAVEPPQEVAPTANSLTMPVQQPVLEQAPIAPVEEQTPIAPVEVEQVAEIDSTPAATQLTDENPVINIPAPITDEPALIELQAPVADEVNTEQPPITVERYKSKPAARAAIKKQKIDPQSVSIVSMEDGYAIVEAGTNQTEQADESVAPMQEQQAELANTESVATDAIELTEQNPVINIPAPVVSKSATEPASTTAKIYKSKPAAQAAIKKQKLSPDSVSINQVKGGGFEIVKKAPLKPTYAQAQEQAATELGMTLDETGEYGGTDAELETFFNRIDEIRGRTLSSSAPATQQPPSRTQAGSMQLTDDNPTVNIPAPKKAPRELSDKAMVREMQKPTANNGEIDYKSKLNLSEGQNLGRLIMSSGRVFDDAVVKSMGDKGITVEATVNGKRGLYKGLQYQTVDAGINNTKSYAKQQAARQEVNNYDNSSPNASEANETADNAGASKAEERVSDRNAPRNAVARQTKARAGLDAPSVDQEVSPPKTYAQENQPQPNVEESKTVAVSPVKSPQSSVAKAETVPETKKPVAKTEKKPEPNPVEKPTPTGDWRSQVGGNEIRDNKDGITVRKHDRVVHIRGANSIAANKKARELASQEIRELHYIAAKENPSDPFSEASIWLDGEGDMIRKKGIKKPSGALLPVLKLAKSNTEPQAPVAKPETAPETKKTAAEKSGKPAEQVAEIEDFGEKITGARKDMDSFYQKEITDDDISSQPLSKIWPKKDIEAIEDKQTAALATVLRGTIPSKPRKGYKLNNWVEQVKNARGIMQQIMGDDTLVGQFIEQMTKVKGLQTAGYHAQLLSAIEQDQWARVTAVDHRPYYAIQNDDGSTSPDMSFDITIDKRRHVIPTDNKQISEVVSKVNELLSGEVKTPTLKFDLYSRGRGDSKSWFITQTSDKDKTPLITFNDRDSARAFLKENNNDLSELWDQYKEKVNVKKTDTRSRQNRARIGPDHRGGQDVTTEQFMEAFGLRGGQFGNWVKQGANSKDRQGMLNDAYDAFMDLAGLLNIPSEAIGLGGKLGMSFGARGKGAAMAHYEPSQVVINLTKTKGAGTLAHEWFHALDHHFTSFRDSPARNKSREDTYITYKPEPSMMYTPQKGRGYLISKPALEKRRANSKDPMYAAENWAPDPSHPEGVRPQVEEAFADLVNTLNDSPMKERATIIDKGAVDGYWSRIIERAARAFESYVINKLDKQGARSDFLANVTPEGAFPRNMDRYPYLLESEMAPVAEAFDNLFATIDSRASEDGNGKTLFSRAGQMKQVAKDIKNNTAKGVTGATSQQIIGALQKRFGKEAVAALIKSGKLRVRSLNDFVNADGRLLIPDDAEGFYYDGKVTLIADNLTPETVVATLLHEMGGHAGIQSMLAPQTYMGLMANFDNLVKSGNKYAVKAKERAEAVTDTESEARDEYIPYLITEYAQATERGGPLAVIKRFVNRVLAGVRAWVRNHTGVQLKMTPNDIVQLAERMVKRLSDQEASPLNIAGIDNMPAGQARFSQAPAPQSQVDAVRKQYEGTDSWMKAPNGLPSKLTELQWLQVRTPSFKNWFGDWENGQRTENATGLNERADRGVRQDKRGKPNEAITRSMDDTRSNGERDSRDTGNKRQSDSPNSSKHNPQRIFNLDPETGEPRVLSHGTRDKFFIFDNAHANKKDFGWLGVGHYFATNEPLARLYAFNKKGDAGLSVMNVYLNARNPFVATQSLKNMIRDGGKAEAEEFTQYLIDNGHDSVVLDNGADNLEVMVLDANQVKSATDNAGTFDSSNPDIRFSRRYSNADQSEHAATKQQRASSAVRLGAAAASAANAGTIRLMRRHVATPQHVAILNPDFRKAHDNIQARLAYENHEAGKVQVHVPEIWQTRLLVGKRKKDIESVSKALFDGTMADKVWDNDELVDKFGLTPKQINLYERMRASINDSLGNMTVDTLSALAKGTKLVNIETINRLKLTDSTPTDHNFDMQKHMTDELERLDKGGLLSKAAVKRMQGQLDDVFKVMDSVVDKFENLIDQGYAPLMRFGNYAVEVRNKDTGELDLFELYEGTDITGPLAQWKAIKDLEKKYDLDKYTISKGTLNPDAFKQFTDKGLNPETVQLFASELGLDSDGAIQAYLKVAISDRSALKRLIHRKKIAGYSEDMPRVVSAFVMSNARHSGRMLYNGEIESSIQKIKDGNLQGEMQNVFKNMEDPQEEYAGVRNTMFHWFMAFSPAFLLLNLTQPFTQTIPKLAAYTSATRAHTDMAHALGIVGKYSGKATWNAAKWVAGKDDPNWQGFEDHLPVWVKKEDYLRMSREGHLDPQNVWMIRGLERGKTGVASGAWGGFENLAGWPAEVSEGINRRSTMIAAFKVAKRMGPAKLKQKGFDSDYEFAVSVIQQTQGIYNKGNRSGLARGTGKLGQFGPLVMVFKQFTINYVEQMIRHGRDKEFKSLALMMLWQFGIAGMFGLPFVDDLRDILEGMLYRVFGKSFNLADELENLMGETAAQNLMYGVPSNHNPIDFYGRSSMGNLLPLTDFARPNEGDWGELIGASSSFFENFYTASKYLAEGRYRDAVVVASPRYVKDAVNGYEIYTTGSYRNHKGDKVMDMSKSDGLIKGLGQFNPSSNAKPGRERSEGYHMKNMIKNNQDRYSLKLAEAIYEENDKLYDEIYEEMDAWNERNKEPYLIDIEKVEKSAENRVEKKDFGSAERNEKALPDQLEGYLEDKAGT